MLILILRIQMHTRYNYLQIYPFLVKQLHHRPGHYLQKTCVCQTQFSMNTVSRYAFKILHFNVVVNHFQRVLLICIGGWGQTNAIKIRNAAGVRFSMGE